MNSSSNGLKSGSFPFEFIFVSCAPVSGVNFG